ncbi:DUF1697 domain-containing protein [Paenibacillus terrigena]|uniref:DUF1697 domain-containing protein n=1 Tax=Paenibacillus terrigena TaxID=369333 RepID=UPI0028D19EDD|nr:DUF1697 domain-containing protein [Paenibacillus terrigena]
MTVYIGFLRGINVGGKNKIKMAELKKMLETMGFVGVETYLQTGNILFHSDDPAEALRKRIEISISEQFGVSPTVVLRTAEQMEKIIADCPYAAESLTEGQTIQISVLTEEPDQQIAEILSHGKSEIDEFQLQGCEIYFLFRQSVLDSKLATNLQKLGDRVTTRNWNTMKKLSEMAKVMP